MPSAMSDSSLSPDYSKSRRASQDSSSSRAKRLKQVQQNAPGFEPIPKKSALIKTDKPRPHICSTCTRAFARLEHLKRHERSHTNEKPFQCAACGRCFARRDLVLRHQQKLHSGLSTNNLKEAIKKGENENIITNFGNKQVSLPTKEGASDDDDDDDDDLISTSDESHRARSFSSSTSRAPKSTIDSVGEHSSLFKHTENRRLSRQDDSVTSSPFDGVAAAAAAAAGTFQSRIHRHNSFSATSSYSYLKKDDIKEDPETVEGPREVGFATPQLTAKDLDNKALMSGIDLDALGLQYDVADFSLDSRREVKAEDYFDKANGGRSSRNGKPSTPFNLGLTPNASFLDMPVMNEYLHIGNAGGGAGFTLKGDSNVSLNLFAYNNIPQSNSNSAAQTPLHNVMDIEGNANGTTASTSIHDDHMSPEDWLGEFINTPFDQNFNPQSKNLNTIGFVPSLSPASSDNTTNSDLRASLPQPTLSVPTTDEASAATDPSVLSEQSQQPQQPTTANPNQLFNKTDISTLFRTRQIDLFKKVIENKSGMKGSFELFTPELRKEIMRINKLKDSQFPELDELNQYVNLFKNEFNKYFPFIHLPTLKPTIENYPLLLSIAAVGALYAFHSGHALLMFNITRYRIHTYLEGEKSFKNNSSIPIWLYQSMVLLIFIGIFNNDLSITKTMTIFLNSLIELVKLTSLNLPLENFITPPPIMDNLQNSSDMMQEANFNYFVLAQSRIRTCHTILLISNLFSSLIGLDCSLHSLDLKCGVHCKWDELWECNNYLEWMAFLEKKHYVIDSKFALVELANGNESYNNCLNFLTLNNYILSDEDNKSHKRLQMKTLLSLLMSIHEKIYLEGSLLKNEENGVIAATKWRMNSRPVIESLIKSWESLYIKNGGVLYLNESSLSIIYNKNPIMRLILPLLSFAKIRKCIHLTPTIESIWRKDWDGMNNSLKELKTDFEALRDATNYAIDIVKLWIDYVSIHNDAEKTSIRTPVFFITCIFTSLLIIAEFLHSVEVWARDYDEKPVYLNAVERTLWLRSEMVFKKIEKCLMLDDNNKTYAEFLRKEAKGALDVESLPDEVAKRAVNPHTDIQETRNVIQNARLSSKGLYLGVRILADAPIWPIALLFAQALKARAIHISKSRPSTPQEVKTV